MAFHTHCISIQPADVTIILGRQDTYGHERLQLVVLVHGYAMYEASLITQFVTQDSVLEHWSIHAAQYLVVATLRTNM